jgi:DNA-directed RNA polymerase specialized sigma24 family protein
VVLIDEHFARVCGGDREAFGDWLAEVEIPLRRSLAPWARAVDVESVMQETLLRMWLFAQDRGHELEGEDASLRWAVGMARNVARNEARRFGREVYLPSDDLPPVEVRPDPPSDPALNRIIRTCLEALTGRPREALLTRLARGHDTPDGTLAASLQMKLNTFRQNIVRARKQVAACLRERGAPIEEHIS